MVKDFEKYLCDLDEEQLGDIKEVLEEGEAFLIVTIDLDVKDAPYQVHLMSRYDTPEGTSLLIELMLFEISQNEQKEYQLFFESKNGEHTFCPLDSFFALLQKHSITLLEMKQIVSRIDDLRQKRTSKIRNSNSILKRILNGANPSSSSPNQSEPKDEGLKSPLKDPADQPFNTSNEPTIVSTPNPNEGISSTPAQLPEEKESRDTQAQEIDPNAQRVINLMEKEFYGAPTDDTEQDEEHRSLCLIS